MSWRVIEADVLDGLSTLENGRVQTCVTSPPYYGLRDYGTEGQIGLEPTPDEYVGRLVAVFREVRRVLRDDGTLWLNLGDSFGPGKQLLGVPWRVAFALQADGWILRSEIIWAKRSCMPESVTDRPTKAHEQIFLLSKSPRYFYDAEAIREESDPENDLHHLRYHAKGSGNSYQNKQNEAVGGNQGVSGDGNHPPGRNKRSVWMVASQPFPGAHFAVFPPKLIEPCVLAGSSPQACGVCGAPWRRVVEGGERVPVGHGGAAKSGNRDSSRGDHGTGVMYALRGGTTTWKPSCDHQDGSGRSVVLDPFNGAGTTGVVASRHDRDYVGIELNSEYAEMSRQRIRDDGPLLNVPSELAA